MIYAAFLRGINVGGNTIVPMAELKKCFEKLGYESVKTYINSGNVVFETQDKGALKLENNIEDTLHKSFGYNIRVMVRSLPEMKKLLSQVPKNWSTNKDQKCNVIFLSRSVDSPKILKELNTKPGIEELHYHTGVLFWSAQTSNLTKSSMIKLSRLPIYKEMTVRGLNTVTKIYELMRAA